MRFHRRRPMRFEPTRRFIHSKSRIRSRESFRAAQICPGATIPRWKLYVPYPQYSSGTASGISSSFVPWANSIYNAAQLRIEKRFAGGLQFLFSYTFQKSIDDASLGSSGYSFLTSGSAVTRIDRERPEQSAAGSFSFLVQHSADRSAQLGLRIAIRPRAADMAGISAVLAEAIVGRVADQWHLPR